MRIRYGRIVRRSNNAYHSYKNIDFFVQMSYDILVFDIRALPLIPVMRPSTNHFRGFDVFDFCFRIPTTGRIHTFIGGYSFGQRVWPSDSSRQIQNDQRPAALGLNWLPGGGVMQDLCSGSAFKWEVRQKST